MIQKNWLKILGISSLTATIICLVAYAEFGNEISMIGLLVGLAFCALTTIIEVVTDQ